MRDARVSGAPFSDESCAKNRCAWRFAFTTQVEGLFEGASKKGKHMKVALTIAGSDSSGGAGIQADIKTMTALGVMAESVITALTAQNTLGVQGVAATEPAFVELQIESVFSDIRPDAVKIGMLPTADVVRAVARGLRRFEAKHMVLDPVMVSTSGAALSEDSAVRALVEELFPLAEVVTPNIPEAEVLSGLSITSKDDMLAATYAIQRLGAAAVLIKGGHLTHDADDVLLLSDGRLVWYAQERVDTPNTHGTGCTLSSAIASWLARGCDVEEAVRRAKFYLTGALSHDLNFGAGSGPVNHVWQWY